jgi:ubiquinone/menaquinone biosynthesis C-methylase UbiE
MAIDETKLNDFLGRFVTDLGATIAAGNVVVGHRLGLYAALAERPATADELARHTECNPRYIAEWLRGQAAGGYVEYDAAADRYSMTEEQAFALANPDGAIYAPGAFVLALGTLKANDRITAAFRTGDGMGWHEHDEDVFIGCEQFFRPGYIANLVPSWIPALEGVEAKLRRGAKVADLGCGLGASTVLLAAEYPSSSFFGSDYHERSVELARKRAADAGVADRTQFEVSSAADFAGTGYDLVATFDCLHDMGDPLATAKHVRQAIAADGTWLVVEPAAGDSVAENLNPVGRVYYNFSSQLCVPNALSQSGGFALGAQAGEAAIRRLMTDAGFTRFRRAAETPFNLVYEVRP